MRTTDTNDRLWPNLRQFLRSPPASVRADWNARRYFQVLLACVYVLPQRHRRRWLKGKGRFCPVCSEDVRFYVPHGAPLRSQARCPTCAALERHRLLWLYLERRTGILDRHFATVLHAAVEPILARRIANLPWISYHAYGLQKMPNAGLDRDYAKLPFQSERFHLVICNHVLEHSTDPIAVLTEVTRVLKKHGTALLQVGPNQPIVPPEVSGLRLCSMGPDTFLTAPERKRFGLAHPFPSRLWVASK